LELVKSSPRYVKRLHEAGNQVFVWTVDDLDDVEAVQSLGVDAIITNVPDQVTAHLRGNTHMS
jgi:glycerophosphoryl diester phosphodiesterase